ncbi:MAG: methyl-accepting chemotaxis protein [Massilia sp.]
MDMFRRLRIGTRLRLGFGLLLAMMVGIVVINEVGSTHNRQEAAANLARSQAKVELTNILKGAQLEGVVAVRSIGIYTDVAAMNREEAKLKKHVALFTETRKQLEALGVPAGGQVVFDRIDKVENDLTKPTADAITSALAFNSEAAADIIANRVDPLYQQLLVELNNLVALQKNEAKEMQVAADASARRLSYLLISIGAVAFVIGLLLSQLITRGIVVPLGAAVALAEKVAAGDLSSQIAVRGGDETADLLRALSDMNSKLVEVVSEVRGGTETISTASAQIASGNADLAQRTEQQAGQLQTTVTSMDDLTSAVRHNEDNASNANELARSASEVALQGGQVVARVVDTMAEINASAREIVDIIAVIEGIAFQTNILALNAAVEAARAGEQGRGFAVVATEVRSLAQRSAEAAKEIKSLIEGSVGKIEFGNALALKAGTTMDAIVDSVGKVTAIMADITHASHTQATDISQVHKAIAYIDEGTQQNAALVEEGAAAAQSMHEMAENLRNVVRIFQFEPKAPTSNITPLSMAARTVRATPPPRAAAARRRLGS